MPIDAQTQSPDSQTPFRSLLALIGMVACLRRFPEGQAVGRT